VPAANPKITHPFRGRRRLLTATLGLGLCLGASLLSPESSFADIPQPQASTTNPDADLYSEASAAAARAADTALQADKAAEMKKNSSQDEGWLGGTFSSANGAAPDTADKDNTADKENATDSDSDNDTPEAKVVIIPAAPPSDAASMNAAAQATGEAVEEKSDAAVAAMAVPGGDAKGAVKEIKETQGEAAANAVLVAAKAESKAKVPTSSSTEPPHADVFAQPKAPATTVDTPVAPLTPIDQGAVSPEQAHAWAEEMQMLERENASLRDRLQANMADPLADIKVDAVTQIREDVLRARVVELERELDKLHMNHDGDLPQKTTPGKPSAEATPTTALTPPATTATP
jgi:polyhydroxyalkanoate synthesis regulator phasin